MKQVSLFPVEQKPKKESRNEYIRRIWREAEDEVSKPHEGKCATCGAAGTVLPYMDVGGGKMVPLDRKHKGYRGPGMIRGVLVCPCCSYPACRHCLFHGVMRDGHEWVNGECARCGKQQVAA
jgi:hypothetical protein